MPDSNGGTAPTRVLIIEDDEPSRLLYRDYLEQANYVVTESANGIDAVRLIREQTPNLVITDIFMPRQDGLEVILTIKSEFDSIPVLAISGGSGAFAGDNYLKIAREFGAEHILRKPFTRSEFLSACEQTLRSLTP